jgi:DNA-binding transcriptional regulator YiaG
LSINIETIGDWLRAKRIEKNLTPGHMAVKMGNAQSLVRSWECVAKEPNQQQLVVLRDLLDAKPFWQAGHKI